MKKLIIRVSFCALLILCASSFLYAIEEKEQGVNENEWEEITQQIKRICPNCGAVINDPDARFCPECGYKLRRIGEQEKPKETEESKAKASLYYACSGCLLAILIVGVYTFVLSWL